MADSLIKMISSSERPKLNLSKSFNVNKNYTVQDHYDGDTDDDCKSEYSNSSLGDSNHSRRKRRSNKNAFKSALFVEYQENLWTIIYLNRNLLIN